MSKLTNWIVLLAASLMLNAAAANPIKVNIGYVSASDWLPAIVAEEKGYFEQNGLDVEMTKIALISNIPASLMANSLHIGAATPTMLIDAADAGMQLTAIAGGTRMLKEAATFSIIAREGTSIKSAKDLEGKRVGVPGIRAIADVLLRKWLQEKGTDVSKVSIVETPFPQMADLLRGGQVDAVTALEPFRSRIVDSKAGYRVVDYVSEVNPDLLGSAWIARREWLDKNPSVAEAFRKSIAEGIAFIKEHPEQAREIEKNYFGVTSLFEPPYAMELTEADFEAYINIGKDIGYLKKDVDSSSLIYK